MPLTRCVVEKDGAGFHFLMVDQPLGWKHSVVRKDRLGMQFDLAILARRKRGRRFSKVSACSIEWELWVVSCVGMGKCWYTGQNAI